VQREWRRSAVRMRITPTILPGMVLAYCSAVPAWAQEKPDGFYLTSPLSISSGYDSGFVADSRTLSDSVTLLTGPTFDWITTTHRTEFSLDYQPEAELFTNHSSLDGWNHSSTMRFSRRINSRISVNAGNSFLSTMDSSRQLQNRLLLLPLGRFLQNTFYAALDYRLNHATKLTFRADNAITTMDLPGALKGRLDEVTTAGTATLDRSLTARQTLSGSYSFLHVAPLHPEAGGSATNVNLLILGYAYQIEPTLLVRLTAGDVEGSESAFMGSAALEKQWGGVWLAAGYQRYLGFFGALAPAGGPSAGTVPFANGITPSSVYQVFSVRASGQLTKRVGLEAIGQKALSGINDQGNGVRSLIGHLRVSYRLTDRFVLFATAEHYGQNINEFSEQGLSRDRYFGGIEIVLSRPPERNDVRNQHRQAPQDSDELKPGELQPPEENQE
jgi:hypothetical protein